jgi:hypothetical protein
MHGEHIKDVTTCPDLLNGVHTLARLYDLQHDPALRDDLTYVSPTTGDRVGLSFITPQTLHDLEQRRTMMTHWARMSCGMMGRTPDFLNVSMMAMAAERVRLFRLAWDTCCSAFASRQVLYERFFQGDRSRKAWIDAEHAQSDRRRGAAPSSDSWPAFARGFRADPRRSDDPLVNRLLREVASHHTVIDVGAGGGRLALPLALRCRQVVAVEPPASMPAVLLQQMADYDISNVSLVSSPWEEVEGVFQIRGAGLVRTALVAWHPM